MYKGFYQMEGKFDLKMDQESIKQLELDIHYMWVVNKLHLSNQVHY
jgi:hypothetical protein